MGSVLYKVFPRQSIQPHCLPGSQHLKPKPPHEPNFVDRPKVENDLSCSANAVLRHCLDKERGKQNWLSFSILISVKHFATSRHIIFFHWVKQLLLIIVQFISTTIFLLLPSEPTNAHLALPNARTPPCNQLPTSASSTL
jgi:hypothetical protein